MDPATEAIMQMWNTAETIDMILGRVWLLNLNLLMVNFLLTVLIVTLNKREPKK